MILILSLCLLFSSLLNADWTSPKVSEDSIVYYVDPEGDDSNDGLSPQTPLRTTQTAYDKLRDGYPDWMLLKSGARFEGPLCTQWTKSGRSKEDPIVVSVYDGLRRAKLVVSTNVDGLLAQRQDGASTSFVQFHSFHLTKEPRDWTAGPADMELFGASGILWRRAGESILFEDVEISFFGTGFLAQNNAFPTHEQKDITLNRCIVRHSYNTTGGHSQGVFTFGCNGFKLVESIVYHNGWGESRDQTTGGATLRNHNIYCQFHPSGNAGHVLQGNMVAEASSHGWQLRCGGNADNNFVWRCPLGALWGYGDGGEENVAEDSRCINNVFVEAVNVNSTATRGTGIAIQNVGRCDVENNQVNTCLGTANEYGFRVFYAASRPVGYSLKDNVFWKWNNCTPKLYESPFVTLTAEERNCYWAPASGHVTGSNRDSEEVTFPNPDVTLADYSRRINGAGTVEDFWAEALKQSRANWRGEYTAAAVNNYFRDGFGMDSPEGPDPPPEPGPEPPDGPKKYKVNFAGSLTVTVEEVEEE